MILIVCCQIDNTTRLLNEPLGDKAAGRLRTLRSRGFAGVGLYRGTERPSLRLTDTESSVTNSGQTVKKFNERFDSVVVYCLTAVEIWRTPRL